MNKQLLKMAGLATLVLALYTPVFSQDGGSDDRQGDKDTLRNRVHSLDEITIRHKGDKDAKVTIEIKGGEVFVNGKPASEYKDDDLKISKRKFKTLGDGDGEMDFSDGDMTMNMTPFRYKGGTQSYRIAPRKTSPGAFLGVTSLQSDQGPQGAKIGEISEGSAAEKAGLKEGDVITKVDDKTIDGPETLSTTIRKYKPGDKVTITYKRDGKELKATAELGKNKNDAFDLYKFKTPTWNYDANQELQFRKYLDVAPKNFNFNFGDNSLKLGIRAQDTEDGKGVKVVDVDDESAAAKAGIKEGDIITRFDGKEVNSATTLAELARVSREDKTKPTVKVGLLRGGKPLEVEVKTPRKLKTADL